MHLAYACRLECCGALYTSVTQLWLALTLQEADMRRKAKYQEEMQDEYAKIKNRLKNMDIELHTEVRASLCYCQKLKLQ